MRVPRCRQWQRESGKAKRARLADRSSPIYYSERSWSFNTHNRRRGKISRLLAIHACGSQLHNHINTDCAPLETHLVRRYFSFEIAARQLAAPFALIRSTD